MLLRKICGFLSPYQNHFGLGSVPEKRNFALLLERKLGPRTVALQHHLCRLPFLLSEMLGRRQGLAAAGIVVRTLSQPVAGHARHHTLAPARSLGARTARSLERNVGMAGKERGMAASAIKLGDIRTNWT